MQTAWITAPFHHPAGKFIDDDNLATFDDIVGITFKHGPGLKRLINMMDNGGILIVIQIAGFNQPEFPQFVFDTFSARLC